MKAINTVNVCLIIIWDFISVSLIGVFAMQSNNITDYTYACLIIFSVLSPLQK